MAVPMLRLYSLTDAGRKAWDAQSGKLPLDARKVLGLVGNESDPRDLAARLGWSDAAMLEQLRELEEGGYVKSIGAARTQEDLDFTGSFRVEDFQAAAQAQSRKALDFTGSFTEEELRPAREKKD